MALSRPPERISPGAEFTTRSAYLDELKALVRLALPLAGANFGQMLLGAVDTAVVGRRGAVELGAAGLGNSLFFCVSILGMGVMMGLDPLVSQAHGAKQHAQARRTLWQGVWLALAGTIPLGIGILALAAQLEHLGIDAEAANHTRAYLGSRLWGLLPFLLFAALRSYLQSVGRATPMFYGAVLANLINLPMSWVLVFGDAGLTRLGLPALGVPEMGVAGAGYTSAFCTLLQLLVLVKAVRGLSVPEAAQGERFRRPDAVLMRSALRLGLPIGFTLLAEVGIFSLTNVAMGNLGQTALAAHQVAITLASATFMIPLGIGAAASVRVGQAVGARDEPGVRRAGLCALALGVGFMSLGALVFLTLPDTLSRVITDQPEVVAAAVPLLLVAAVFQIFDGAQAVLAGALRGAGDTTLPLILNLAGYYLVGTPVGLGLAFLGGRGAVGLWWGLSSGLIFVALTLGVRFFRLTSRGLRPV
ncbi:MAG: MATE family efflux transporter [Polyangiaceae bacterium]